MKRANNLFPKLVSEENLRLAIFAVFAAAFFGQNGALASIRTTGQTGRWHGWRRTLTAM